MEEWKDIVGYAGLYQVSTVGRVRSLDRMIKNHHGTYYFKSGEIKSQRQKNNGYLIVDLYKDNIQRTFHVHRLVADAFIPNPDRCMLPWKKKKCIWIYLGVCLKGEVVIGGG